MEWRHWNRSSLTRCDGVSAGQAENGLALMMFDAPLAVLRWGRGRAGHGQLHARRVARPITALRWSQGLADRGHRHMQSRHLPPAVPAMGPVGTACQRVYQQALRWGRGREGREQLRRSGP